MRKTTFAVAILTLVGAYSHALAQGSGSSRAAAQGSGSSRAGQTGSARSNRNNQAVPATRRPPTTAEFASSFWGYLSSPKSPYRKWGSPGKKKRQPGQTESDGAGLLATTFHGEISQTYLNNIVNRDLKRVPVNSVLVREEYSADGQALKYITVMYRSQGIDPKNGDWYWMMYNPDGSLAKMRTDQGDQEVAGRVQSCINCHMKAGGNDFVFLNDGPAAGTPPAVSPTVPAGSGSRR